MFPGAAFPFLRTFMENIIVDFESYYHKSKGPSASHLGNDNYFRDSYAYCVSYYNMGTGDAAVGTFEELAPELEQMCGDPNAQIWAANSNFDQGWMEHLGIASYNDWECILDRAAASQFPRNVAGLSKALLGKAVDKTLRDEMSGVHFKDLPEDRQQRILEYCLNDAVEEGRCLELLPDYMGPEGDIARMTRMQNRRGLHVDSELVAADLAELEHYKEQAAKRVPWGEDRAVLSHQALQAWCADRGIPAPHSVAKGDAECDALCAAHPDLAYVIQAMRDVRSMNTFMEKARSVIMRTREDGSIPLDLLYAGAPHTRRWSSQGVNVQNLPRDPLVWGVNYSHGAPQDELEITPRHWLRPRPGNVFVILDYSQIEPRVLNWLVGNHTLLDMLREGYPLYEAFARQWGQWSGDKPLKKGDLALYTRTKNKVLGLGYGMGWSKYAVYGGQNLSEPEARADVDSFRQSNPGIVEFWSGLDRKLKLACMGGGPRTLEIPLPSGETLKHFCVRRTADRGVQTMKVRGEHRANQICSNVWGGFLCENVVQRVARDILAWRAVELWKSGLYVAFTSHDEVIVECRQEDRDAALEEMYRVLSKPPEWADGIPLALEGGFADRYVKEPDPVDLSKFRKG